MARPTKAEKNIEAERLNMIHKQRATLMKALKEPPAVKKGTFLPGEDNKQKNLAIFLKLAQPRVSYTQIAAQIGETKSTVQKWFKEDPYVREQYEWLLHNLTEGALDFLRLFQLEAVATLAILMRFGSEKYMLESARDILDRGGVSKMTRQEVTTNKNETHSWDNEVIEKLRELPEDKQEEAAALLEGVEKFLDEAAALATKEKSGDEVVTTDDSVINEDDDFENEDDEV